MAVYGVPAVLPAYAVDGLTSQLRRAAVSVPANLAEGRCRRGDRDFRRFVGIAMGSASEVEYHLLLSHDLGYIDETRYQDLAKQVEEIKRMLSSLYDRLSEKS